MIEFRASFRDKRHSFLSQRFVSHFYNTFSQPYGMNKVQDMSAQYFLCPALELQSHGHSKLKGYKQIVGNSYSYGNFIGMRMFKFIQLKQVTDTIILMEQKNPQKRPDVDGANT